MNSLLAILLAPAGLLAAIARPFLTFGIFAFMFSGAWAYLNPGWADPAFTERLFWIAGTLYVARYVGDLIQAAITNRI